MKIRKAIAATLIAGTALVGTATVAEAGPAEIEFVEVGGTGEGRTAIFTDGFESGDTARVSHYRWVLKDAIITSYG